MRSMPPAWVRFWFAPTPTSTLAVVRIAYGSVLLGWSVTLLLDASTFFSGSGIVSERPRPVWSWSLLDLSSSPLAVSLLGWLLVVAAVCLVVGFQTRLAAVMAFLALVSFHWRDPFVFQAGDTLLRVFSAYFVFAPAGEALSVDRWRTLGPRRFWEFPERAPVAVRLMQVQLSLLYGFTVWAKLRGTTWNDGTAVSYALRAGELVRLQAPEWITDSVAVTNVLTYATLTVELALATLVWNRRARPWVLAAGVVLHLSIALTIRVGFFSLMMLVGYLAFLPADTMATRLLDLRARLARSRPRPLPRLSAGTQPSSSDLVAPAVGCGEHDRTPAGTDRA